MRLVWRRHFERQGKATAVAVERVGRCTMLRVRNPTLGAADVGALQQALDRRQIQHSVSSIAIAPTDLCLAGSDLEPLHSAQPVARSKYFQAVANLCTSLGESQKPIAVMLDGNISGSALGLATHARLCIVTDRTRLMLPGPEFGFVPESFASFHLARLPGGLGAYLALTGAALNGAEIVQLGLATHVTEPQALPRLVDELGGQVAGGLVRMAGIVEDACITPPQAPEGPGCALHFAREIEECFGGLGGGGRSLPETLALLEAGPTEWHAQALERLRASSPLALRLSLALLERAAASECWARTLGAEAAVSAAALGAPDCAAGLARLGGLKAALVSDGKALAASDRLGGRAGRGAGEDGEDGEEAEAAAPVAWEHEAVEAVEDAAIAPYLEAAL